MRGAVVSRILVTGSADGLGRLAADSLLSAGHEVVVHARNQGRAASLKALIERGAISWSATSPIVTRSDASPPS